MDCAEGQELEKRLPDVPRSKIRSIVDQVARAAIFLRERGLSHRDLKSANVFVSDDFDRVKVLDLSVVRDIHDPLGIGTDHHNQLPVVATSRYTPPEYLFRLHEPSPELWHGVDVYQLGGLLHDLIMREPMFSSEYSDSSENRYRFAWIVATMDPVVRAIDVDADLILLARRALDKNWSRRRQLRLTDFLSDSGTQTTSLAAIGLTPSTRGNVDVTGGLRPVVANKLAIAVDDHVLAYLRERGITATHRIEPGDNDMTWSLLWTWGFQAPNVASYVELKIELGLVSGRSDARVKLLAYFTARIDGIELSSQMDLPETPLAEGAEVDLARLIEAALGPLSAKAMSAQRGDP